jgi:hypothetical protein
MKYFLLMALACNFFLFNSCAKYKPATAAFFIKTSSVSVSTTTLQGTSSNKISDVYVYVNGNFKGAYQKGNLIPIPTDNKKVTIDFFAGIKNNGIQDLSISWLFYDKIEIDTLVESGKTIDRPLTFKYNPNTKFVWLENFEGNGVSLIKSTGYATDTTCTVKIISGVSDCFEGKSIELGYKSNSIQLQAESSLFYALPTGNTNVYLEMNYKSDGVFEVGVADGVNLKGALQINPSSSWNKIYVQLSEAVSSTPVSSSYKIYFKMPKPNDNPNAHVWLDNIKLIYL